MYKVTFCLSLTDISGQFALGFNLEVEETQIFFITNLQISKGEVIPLKIGVLI